MPYGIIVIGKFYKPKLGFLRDFGEITIGALELDFDYKQFRNSITKILASPLHKMNWLFSKKKLKWTKKRKRKRNERKRKEKRKNKKEKK